ncbi:fumarylacetoacetase [Tsukamurella ocularis]|uniref:fumarylacetoacetase n=1 Tax=Tsukamurella ocularis TaxID=1970234 RepID=UPI002167A11D|nr:fumarylacetoacetase [Tsukamurella ocularis]MCS3779048.1 fumarylacetoacetase [Tsukamurella ocularis]MCS3787332.1 fumarylacetoacetase [Tsukamurella ocularis]MCS3851731.1 fumarylacetoacetase [Tsukamurella ocularis]
MTTTWAPVPAGSGFGVENLPYGVFRPADAAPRAGVRIGEHVLDLSAALGDPVFAAPSLNGFLARGRADWRRVRAEIIALLTDPARAAEGTAALHPVAEVTLLLPFEVADYVDFYASEQHATNLGRLFRPDSAALLPNWKHLPVGYHGRAGTVVASGTPIVRPAGQRKAPSDEIPVFGPSVRLDIETELGFVVGAGSDAGKPVGTGGFAEHVFGVCIVNDWSARDIQAWEYVPLGPFLGKSFATSVSPWIVPLEALEAARIATPPQSPEPLPHLRDVEDWGLDIELEVELNGETVSRPPYAPMYWSPAQILAHMTSNGARLRTGDLFASGTVSGPERDQQGSLIELTWNGAEPLRLADGSERTFLADGDIVTLRATAPAPGGGRIDLGEVTGRIAPTPA